LHADDTPHQIALGVAIATLVGLLPIMGIQTVIALATAAALRANKAVCIPVVWITNPVTFVPIYAGCLALGSLMLGSSFGSYEEAEAAIRGLFQQHGGIGEIVTAAFWRGLLEWSLSVGTELWVGCSVVGLAVSVPAYVITRWLVVGYRRRHRHLIERRKRRKLFKAQPGRKTVTGGTKVKVPRPTSVT
jgi:uncharacterized protein (DUF2062 family)